ncbi:BglG family transcription antiterminator [Granulicatella sp. UMB5615A]|jgi:hypothetical protein|uniref:BglG family transcription antiterminator n=2 Tax=unclassified Granulicatella TaxID=2630493 RepID=UPI002552C0C5|nr:BglG family transcription antiterminator [Granulicatella sp. UMB5615A]MDK8522646.1 BglG family transcription antiterminator [Granulicatella sp. UMB5615A]
MNARQIFLLEFLLKQHEYLSANQLAEKYGVSTKTVYQDIDKLNDFFDEGELKSRIVKVPRKGIKLSADEERKQIHSLLLVNKHESGVQDFSPEYRESELIKRLFINQEDLDIYDFAEEMYVTESTVHRDIDKLEKNLGQFDLKIRIKHDQLFVDGDEWNIRKALQSYVIQAQSLGREEKIERFFSEKDIEICYEAISRLSQKYHHQFSEEYSCLLLVECLVFKKRTENNNCLTERTSNLINDLNHLEVYFFSGELLESIINKSFSEISPYEIEAMAYSLLAYGFSIQSADYIQNIEHQVNELINKVSNLLSLDLSKDNHLKLMLSNHISKMIFRLRNQIYITNPALEEIKKQYSSLFNVIWIAIRGLSKYYEINISNEELAFIVIHFQLAIEKIVKPLNIVVICQNGIATSELIMSKLHKIFDSDAKITNINARELDFYDLSNIDLIISTIALPEVKVPVIEVSPILTKDEIESIRSFYSEHMTDNYTLMRTSLDGRKFNLESLQTLIKKPSLIRETVKSKKECIEKMIRECDATNRRIKEFKESILERETLGSTSVYTGVALPHCDPRFVEQSELIVMTLDKPINWGKNNVKLIILIAVAENDIPIFKDSLIALYSVIENQELMNELVQLENGDEIKNRLLKEVSQNAK